MNIFVLDRDPIRAAQMHCDKHVIKMITESCQIMSTVLRRIGDQGDEIGLYRSTHERHPCILWAGERRANFLWLLSLLDALIKEYDFRWGKPDTFVRARGLVETFFHLADLLPDGPMTPFAQAMPDQYRDDDAVVAYRNYYVGEKGEIAQWTRRSVALLA